MLLINVVSWDTSCYYKQYKLQTEVTKQAYYGNVSCLRFIGIMIAPVMSGEIGTSWQEESTYNNIGDNYRWNINDNSF